MREALNPLSQDMPKLLYIWQAGFPWEVRAEKICLALLARGWEVTLLARWKPGQPREDLHKGVRVVRVGHSLPSLCSLPVSVNPLWKDAIRREIDRWKPDVVVAREILLAEAASRACWKRKLPMIIDMAEHYPATLRTFKKYRRNVLLRLLVFHAKLPERVEKKSVARADGIITVCEEQNHRLTRCYGYPPAQMAVVHNTPSLAAFAGVRTGASMPPRVFAYHGHMTPQRGLDHLIRGFALAAKHDPGLRLLLAGGGESFADLVGLAQRCGIAERVEFTGPYRFEALPDLYSRTDVGFVPYPTDESCQHTIPNKLYDYLACGKPVIVSAAEPLRRVVEETGAGLVVDGSSPAHFAGAIQKMTETDARPLSEGGLRAACEKYNWDCDAATTARFLSRYV